MKTHFHYVLHGQMNSRGQQVGDRLQWNFTFPAGNDSSTDLETIPLDGQWFAAAFPGATFATWASPFEGLLGVYEVSGDEVLLRGYVTSREDGATELHHDPAVRVVRFPISVGDQWEDQSVVSGKLFGYPWVQSERFQFQVDAAGTAVTLAGAAPAFRQRMVRTRISGATTTVDRSDTFFTECLGMVARLTAEKNQPEDFQDAAEIWSLAP